MKRYHHFRLNVPLAIAICTLTVGLAIEAATAETNLFVQVESAKLRAAPQQWAKPLVSLSFGDQITKKGDDRGWIKGTNVGHIEGFIHESAVTQTKIILKPIGASLAELTVDGTDVYLAGKGFNVDTEAALAKTDTTLNYSAVDDMVVSARAAHDKVEAFVNAGGLTR
jgi:hypothetical protein